jgi:hypothetical protein
MVCKARVYVIFLSTVTQLTSVQVVHCTADLVSLQLLAVKMIDATISIGTHTLTKLGIERAAIQAS